jgi:hypothetical protein
MNFRVLGLGAVGAGIALLPGSGFLAPFLWVGRPHAGLLIPLALLIFCVVYFGVIKFWELMTGESLQKPLPAILALFLLVRLTVDCARMLMWW